MGEAGTVLVLVASLWASVNAIVAGYEAVNRTRDRIVLGEHDGLFMRRLLGAAREGEERRGSAPRPTLGDAVT